MTEQEEKMSLTTRTRIERIRRVAEDRKKAEQEKLDKKMKKFRDLMLEIRRQRHDLCELAQIVFELLDNEIINTESDLVCNIALLNLAISDRGWKCFGLNGVIHVDDEEIENREDSLFYDFKNDRFIFCKGYYEDRAAFCTDDWLARKCVEHREIADALTRIVTCYPDYRKKVLRFVDNLR